MAKWARTFTSGPIPNGIHLNDLIRLLTDKRMKVVAQKLGPHNRKRNTISKSAQPEEIPEFVLRILEKEDIDPTWEFSRDPLVEFLELAWWAPAYWQTLIARSKPTYSNFSNPLSQLANTLLLHLDKHRHIATTALSSSLRYQYLTDDLRQIAAFDVMENLRRSLYVDDQEFSDLFSARAEDFVPYHGIDKALEVFVIRYLTGASIRLFRAPHRQVVANTATVLLNLDPPLETSRVVEVWKSHLQKERVIRGKV